MPKRRAPPPWPEVGRVPAFRNVKRHQDQKPVRAFDQGRHAAIVRQELRRVDGVLAAEVTSVSGLLDLNTRRLIPDPGGRWRALAANPTLLGL
jgi:hypothetical protein